jgi:hypothetical protein
MSRQGRLNDYAHPQGWVSGLASEKKNLDYWEDRAEKNSLTATRAKGGKMDLPSTGKMNVHSTSRKAGVDPDKLYDRARSEANSYSSSYMKGVRRTSGGA